MDEITNSEEPQVAAPIVETNNAVEPKKGIPKWLKVVGIVFAVIAVLVAVIFSVVNLATAEPQKVSNEFLTEMRNGNSSDAYKLTSNDFQATTSQSDFAKFVNTYKYLPLNEGKISSKEAKSDPTGSNAEFNYVITQDGAKYNIKTELVKSQDEWKVSYFYVKSQ